MKTAHRQDMTEKRRADTRSKIQLGGLVVKAGLADTDATFLLGVLLTGAESRSDPEFVSYMKAKGLAEMHASKRRDAKPANAF